MPWRLSAAPQFPLNALEGQAPQWQEGTDSCSSGCSSFLPHRSRPGQYVFMYQVKIKNQMADTTVKLWGRHWIVEDANGFTEDVR